MERRSRTSGNLKKGPLSHFYARLAWARTSWICTPCMSTDKVTMGTLAVMRARQYNHTKVRDSALSDRYTRTTTCHQHLEQYLQQHHLHRPSDEYKRTNTCHQHLVQHLRQHHQHQPTDKYKRTVSVTNTSWSTCNSTSSTGPATGTVGVLRRGFVNRRHLP